jgi:3-hydroxy-9,10-secoandrosta-1,3,5(10)-triene-9,17-dione monooxygenase reductase component
MEQTRTGTGGSPATDGGSPDGRRADTIVPARLREVLGHLPTGVTVIAAATEAGPVGMSANSFTSVSLDPPLVLLCPAKSSTTWPGIRRVGCFCVNVMAGHHEEVCRQFARKGEDRFKGVSWHPRSGGPALDDAVAWLDCEINAEHDAGDHTIVVARVLDIDAASELRPLVFFRGRYGTFS